MHVNNFSESFSVHCKKKKIQDLSSQIFFFFCQMKLNNLFSSDNLLFRVSDDLINLHCINSLFPFQST